MTAIAFIIVGMTTRRMCDFNVCALERILSARRAVADDRAGGLNRNTRCFFDAAGRSRASICILVHTIEVIKIAFAAVGCSPIVSVERHRRFGVADQVADIECIAAVRFPPERIFANALQDVLSVIDRERRQLRAVVKGVFANCRRGAGDLSRGQIDAVLKPVREIGNSEVFHVIKPDLRDLIPDSRPRLVVLAGERITIAGAGDHQPVVFVQLPLDLAAGDRAGGGCFGRRSHVFVRGAVVDSVCFRFSGEYSHGQREQHTQSQHKCGEFLEILHHAASLSVTAAMVNTIVAALALVTASLADTFAL